MKKTNVAGTFYPKSPSELQQFFKQTILPILEPSLRNQKPHCLLVPHAGYIYSGTTAAKAYSRIQNHVYTKIIILAPSHYHALTTAAVYPSGEFETPLGTLTIAEQATWLSQQPAFSKDTTVFEKEHALEVQLPFIKYLQPQTTIIPILVGQLTPADIETISATLLTIIDDDSLLVISTDLAHFHPAAKNDQIDRHTLKQITKNNYLDLLNSVTNGNAELCGVYPVCIALRIGATQGKTFTLLAHTNSGIIHPAEEVVGYAAAYW